MHSSDALHFEQHGEAGSPVVLIHGLTLDRRMWRPQIDVLAQHHRVYVIDLPGSGESPLGSRHHSEPPSLALLADDVVEFIDLKGLSKAHVVGFSLGGYVTLEAMERSPGCFASAVLADTRADPDGEDERARRLARAARLAQPGATMREMVEEFAPLLTHSSARPEVKQRVAQFVSENDPSNIAWIQMAAAGRRSTYAALRQGIPTLIVVGEHDTVTPPSEAQAMAEAGGGLPLVVIPNAGHMSNMENPDRFNREVLAFFQKVDNQSARSPQ